MNKLLVFFLLGIILIIPMISAVPPVTTVQQFTEGLIIVTSPQQYLKQNQDFTVNFFVHNQSNGRHISNSSTNCSFYLDNSNGTLVLSQKVNYNENDYWDIVIKGGNFSETEQYNYGIDCHHTFLGGSTSGAYIVNPLGDELTSSKAFLYILLFVVSILIFIGLSIFGIYLPVSNKKDELSGYILAVSNLKYLKYLSLAFAYLVSIIISYLAWMISYAYLSMNFLSKLFQFAFYFQAVVALPLFILFTYINITNLIRDSEVGELLSRGLTVKE